MAKIRNPQAHTVLRGLVGKLLQGEFRIMVARWDLDESEGGYKVQVR